MIIRVQSPDGTKRIECQPSESTAAFVTKVQSAFDFPSVYSFSLFTDRDKSKEILNLERRTLRFYNLKHGDMVYLDPKPKSLFSSSSTDASELNSSQPSSKPSVPVASGSSLAIVEPKIKIPPFLMPQAKLEEDEVDVILSKMKGSIERKRDERFCRHGDKGRCIHCIPLEPYDENYLKEQNIKHLSFHSYLRKLSGGIDRGKFAALEYVSCRINENCKEHPPWPKAFCIKCAPSAITLSRQTYRHIDNVTFENAHLVDRFLDYWRVTGHQRFGYLYGRYEVHKDVPLGIKASVAAIYEPPQESGKDQLKLLPDEKQELVDEVARKLGLRRVGWIFTDLEALDLQQATVKHFRGASTYFLSADECIMAGYLQYLHPNVCREASKGQFGSKFVTVCVTGDQNNQVHMEGYQVSNQCMALVRDDCLIPTKDAPELGYIRESTSSQYVPDVYYKVKDQYGNEVNQLARPFPIEYMLVDVPASMPVEPQFTFYASPAIKPFPVENRLVEGHIQDFQALSNYLRQFPGDKFLNAMSDFHFLIYIAQMEMLPLKDHLGPLLDAVRLKDESMALSWAKSEQWATVEHLLNSQETSPSGPYLPHSSSSGNEASGGTHWTCIYCTFINQPGSTNCDMCSLPQSQ